MSSYTRHTVSHHQAATQTPLSPRPQSPVTCYTSSKKDTRRTGTIFHPVTFLVAFGIVLVALRTGWCVIVDVRVASPLAKSASTQLCVGLELASG